MENNYLSGEKKPEIITDKNGNQFTLSNVRNSMELMGKCAPTIEEAAKNIKSFAEALSKHKTIFNTKASN